MEQLRPAGAGRRAQVAAIVRSSEPRAVLVVATDDDVPSDWPTGTVAGLDANLGHALGWTCEVRADDIVVLNPLGEGWLRAERPELGADWRDNAGHSASCSILVVAPSPEGPLAALAAAEAAGTLRGATIRTSISDQAPPTVGRNAPCPCGSGKKFKHCCG